MKAHTKEEKQFFAWAFDPDSCTCVPFDESDAAYEIRQGTPKHRHRPECDWDRFNNFLPKGTQR